MNVSSFLKHWSIRENPFMAEEARQDEVLARLHGQSPHPDFYKVLGDLNRPASSVVFGEKGSGKTAIRLLLEERINEFDAARTDSAGRTLVIAYDEWNPVLDRFARRVKGKTPLESLQQLRLVDHIDGLLSVAVADLVDAVVGRKGEGHVELGPDARQSIRKLDRDTQDDWIILQTLYDRPDQAINRGRLLRRTMRFRRGSWLGAIRWVRNVLWVLLVAGGAAYAWRHYQEQTDWLMHIGLGALALVTLVVSAKVTFDRLRLSRLARLLSYQLRVLDRPTESFRTSLELLPTDLRASAGWPVDDLDDPRYAMLERLERAVKPFGFNRIVVLIDRVDEPTLVSGDVNRMKAVVWPLFNNKFLQQSGIAFKMMLPIELRHELHRQSSDFFQEARLDKQNLIDRLSWSGAMLYDLCTARLRACMDEGVESIALTAMFDQTVSRQDIVDALDQMRQPRDAFKMMYRVIQEHCSNTPEEEANWRIPKLVLEQVRRQQSERLEGLQRGLRPA
jgi:hypothetical protein